MFGLALQIVLDKNIATAKYLPETILGTEGVYHLAFEDDKY